MTWRWRLAMLAWLCGLILLVLPESAQAAVEVGDVRFGLGQVVLIFAAGLAWNDVKRDIRELRKDFDDHRTEERKARG